MPGFAQNAVWTKALLQKFGVVLVEGYQDNDRPVWVSHHGDVIAEWETFFRPGSQLQPVTVMWPCF